MGVRNCRGILTAIILIFVVKLYAPVTSLKVSLAEWHRKYVAKAVMNGFISLVLFRKCMFCTVTIY